MKSKIISELLDQFKNEAGISDITIQSQGCFQLSPTGWQERVIPNAAHLESEWMEWLLDELQKQRRSYDARSPFIDLVIPGAWRIHWVCSSTVSQHEWRISLRRIQFEKTENSSPWKTSGLNYELLKKFYLNGANILIAGATGSGKSTLAKQLLMELPPSERVIILEDTPELFVHERAQFVRLTSRAMSPDGYGEISIRECLRQSLRMRPDRICLGECRGQEVLELLQVMNTGHRGCLATIHANSARESIRRIELLCQLHSNISINTLRELIRFSIQLIAFTERKIINGKITHQISEIIKIESIENGTLLTKTINHGH